MHQRIVSLTPSITETLFAIGAGHRVVGVTDACDYPPEAHAIPHVCSWFEPDVERIAALSPDLVIGLETAHNPLRPVMESLGIRLVQVNPGCVSEAISDIRRFGRLLDEAHTAENLVDGLLQRLNTLAEKVDKIKPGERLTVSRVLDIEKDELMIAGPQSFQYDVIERAGGINVSTGMDAAYPKISFKKFKSWDPEMVFVCGSDKNRIERLKAEPQWRILSSVKNNRLYQFHCGLTCRTGPRIVDMVELLFQTLYEKSGDGEIWGC